jgi:hypothetical protein
MTQRIEPPPNADEKTTTLAYLDFQRATLAWKCENLTPEQLARRAVPTSTLSLLGLVRHLAEVERSWFDRVAGESRPGIYFTDAEPDLDFDGAVDDPAVVARGFADWQAGSTARARSPIARRSRPRSRIRGPALRFRYGSCCCT